jgi:hypothetical protein
MTVAGSGFEVISWARRPVYIVAVLTLLAATAFSHASAADYDVIGGPGLLDWDSDLDGAADGWWCSGSENVAWSASLAPGGANGSGNAQSLSIPVPAGRTGHAMLGTYIDVGEGNVVREGDVLTISAQVRANLSRGVAVVGVLRQETAEWTTVNWISLPAGLGRRCDPDGPDAWGGRHQDRRCRLGYLADHAC